MQKTDINANMIITMEIEVFAPAVRQSHGL